MVHEWTVEIAGDDFVRFMRKLPEYERDVVDAAIHRVLAVEGIAICDTEWGKALGGGCTSSACGARSRPSSAPRGLPMQVEHGGVDPDMCRSTYW